MILVQDTNQTAGFTSPRSIGPLVVPGGVCGCIGGSDWVMAGDHWSGKIQDGK